MVGLFTTYGASPTVRPPLAKEDPVVPAMTDPDALVAHFTPTQRINATLEDCTRALSLLLLRKTGPRDEAYWLPLVDRGMKRKEVFRAIFRSEEFRALPEIHRQAAADAFRTVFGRYASLPGAIQWFHSIPMPDGEITDGLRPYDVLKAEADAIFDMPLEGRSLMDIGAWDGFFSFEAERRGAGDILSVDHPSWSGDSWGTKDGYDLAHATLGSKARSKDVDLFDLNPDVEGRFDVVLFLGVLYHLKNPLGGLERAANMAREVLVVETETDCNTFPKPVLRHFPGREMNNDASNQFAPNVAALRSMLGDLGFARIEVRTNPGMPQNRPGGPGDAADRNRHIVHAWRS